jgi:hypothetical protein
MHPEAINKKTKSILAKIAKLDILKSLVDFDWNETKSFIEKIVKQYCA